MLERLNEVQERDLKLDALDAERADVPSDLVALRREKTELDERLATRTGERDVLRARVREAELELAALRERTKTASESALRADSAKEAAQFQNQELQFSTRAQEIEEDVLPLMEELEGLEAAVTELEETLAELTPRLQEMEQRERDRLEEIDRREGSLAAEREAAAGEVPKPLLTQYEQVRRARRGVGLVELAGGSCGGCAVKLPIHVLQKAKRAGAGVVRCPNCGRILWNKTEDAA